MPKIKRFFSRNPRIKRMLESENIVLRQLDRWRKSRKQHIFSNSRGRTFLSSFIVLRLDTSHAPPLEDKIVNTYSCYTIHKSHKIIK